ncbi:hypothetical protein EVAR_36424_1 [Eumeta japonica]|uniref:Uncharacterized protein n=1 Tax=Eumeta variegata TaxID=151549 RepID=A0A4C1VNK9_EUMVA|nr:hypothetical protein EVAR_36424_1 [Eumeta japonica]
MVNVPAFTTYCGLGAERIGPITAISRSCANPFASDPRSFVGAAISVILTSSPQFKRPKTVKYQTSLPFPASTIQPASTHQVITFPDVHVSAGEDMPSSSRTFRVSSPTEALLDPESGSSYDDSEFSDDDDAEYLVTSAKSSWNLSNDESYHLSSGVGKIYLLTKCLLSDNDKQPLPNAKASNRLLPVTNQLLTVSSCLPIIESVGEEKNNNEENVDDCDERLRPGGQGQVGD